MSNSSLVVAYFIIICLPLKEASRGAHVEEGCFNLDLGAPDTGTVAIHCDTLVIFAN